MINFYHFVLFHRQIHTPPIIISQLHSTIALVELFLLLDVLVFALAFLPMMVWVSVPLMSYYT